METEPLSVYCLACQLGLKSLAVKAADSTRHRKVERSHSPIRNFKAVGVNRDFRDLGSEHRLRLVRHPSETMELHCPATSMKTAIESGADMLILPKRSITTAI